MTCYGYFQERNGNCVPKTTSKRQRTEILDMLGAKHSELNQQSPDPSQSIIQAISKETHR